MKITSINNPISKQNNKDAKSPSFKGGAVDGLVNFWQFVDNGGRALQFTMEDMWGTNILGAFR